MRVSLPIVVLLAACSASDAPKERAAVPPWVFLEASEPDSFYQVVDTQIQGAVAPTQIDYLKRRALVFVTDEAAGRVHVLDDRYRQSGDRLCIDAAVYGEATASSHLYQGDCQEGEVEQSRGYLSAETPFVALDMNSERLKVRLLTQEGLLYEIKADVMERSGLDYLRLLEPILDLEQVFEGTTVLRSAGRWVWIASGGRLQAFDETTGEVQESYQLPGDVLDFEFSKGEALVSTTAGLWRTDGLIEGSLPASDLYRNLQRDIWAVFPDTEMLTRLSDGLTAHVPGLTGPIDGETGTTSIWALAGDELVLVDPTVGEKARYPAEGVVDISAVGKFELSMLYEDGRVVGVFDQSYLNEGTPLSLLPVSFFSESKQAEGEQGCTEVEGYLELASRNGLFAEDVPGKIALGASSSLSKKISECDLGEVFSGLIASPNFELGAIIDDPISAACAEEQDCYVASLVASAESIREHGSPIAWASGMLEHFELGGDWVQGLVLAEIADRYLSFGFSILPRIHENSDSRASEQYPIEIIEYSEPWISSEAGTVEWHYEDGDVAFFPGDKRAAQRLGGCPNLLVRECEWFNQASLNILNEDDIEVLDLMLHRVLAERNRKGDSAWSFQLPELGSWDYTSGCADESRIWEGECGASYLQEWLFSVHRTFVLNGGIRWALPSELAWPVF